MQLPRHQLQEHEVPIALLKGIGDRTVLSNSQFLGHCRCLEPATCYSLTAEYQHKFTREVLLKQNL